MGCSASASTSVHHRVATGRSPPSSPSLHRYDDHERGYNFFKVILIGAGESGKSTVFKQLCRYTTRYMTRVRYEQHPGFYHSLPHNMILSLPLIHSLIACICNI